ncbi:TIGR02679 family protein [Actinomadura fulvescens]|uniref:TIGR02679 family protein n=1 Tax=Actinomadura fulvescens TaxID=46160 RepID=A0ABN3PJZ4_9ACTN
MRAQTRAWLDQPALTRLWDRLHERLERNGLEARGRIRLTGVDAEEREALSLLLGRPLAGSSISISLEDLEERLVSGAAEQGLVDVVAELRGPPANRPALRNARREAAQAIWSAAEQALTRHGLDLTDWANPWLTETRRSGALTRLAPDRAARLIVQAVEVVAALTARNAGPARRGRGELAEQITGTAHGLDDDTLLSRIVLRALARLHEVEPPQDAWTRRALWETAGIATDRVSSTVLTFGLRPVGGTWQERGLRERSEAGAETHLTLRDLHRMTWRLPPDIEVHVCENPRIVEAAADTGCSMPIVCASGSPTTTVLTLLDALSGAGARFAYRGDFDWPGVAMANRMIARYDARPWRMGAADYEDHVASARDRGTPLQALAGSAVEASWDPELAAAMRALNVAVQEESALELLLADLQ